MGEELSGVKVESIENRGADGTWIRLNGIEYKALDYVEPYVSRRRIGELVNISFGISKDDGKTRVLTKIVPDKKPPGGSGNGGGKPSSSTPDQKAAKEIGGILRKISDPYLMLTENGKNKIFCISPMKRDMILEDPKFHPPQEITIAVDPNSFVMKFILGEPVDDSGLPPIAPPVNTAGEIKRENESKKILEENLKKAQEHPPERKPAEPTPGVVPAAKGDAPLPDSHPKGETPKEPQEITGKVEEPCTSPPSRGSIILRLGGTVNIEQFENLKLEVEGEIDPTDPQDRETLIRLWDDTLALFGKNSPATRDKIEAFRKRVIMGAISK